MEKIILRIRFEYQGDWPDEEKKVGGSGGGGSEKSELFMNW